MPNPKRSRAAKKAAATRRKRAAKGGRAKAKKSGSSKTVAGQDKQVARVASYGF